MRTPEKFMLLVEQMRAARKEYFKSPNILTPMGGDITPKQRWLIESKKLESQVDQEIKDFHAPKLF